MLETIVKSCRIFCGSCLFWAGLGFYDGKRLHRVLKRVREKTPTFLAGKTEGRVWRADKGENSKLWAFEELWKLVGG